MQINVHAHTDKGRIRANNEDYLHVDPNLRLYIVCDGMGGHEAGEVAAQLCALGLARNMADNEPALHDALTDAAQGKGDERDRVTEIFQEALLAAGREIYESAQANPAQRGMGCTCTALLLWGRMAYVAHVGDSRLYLVRDGRIWQITEDHTLLQEEISAGRLLPEDAERFPHKNTLTRAMGVMPQVPIQTTAIELVDKDRFVLVTDGVTAYVGNTELAHIVGGAREVDPLPHKLLSLANERGGRDNATAIVLEVNDVPKPGGEPDVPVKLEMLGRTGLFQDLDYVELIRCLNVAYTRRAAANDEVVAEGVEGDSMYVLLEGTCTVSVRGTTVARLGPGEHFGEMSLIDAAPRSATVRAEETCKFLLIDRKGFERLVRADARLGAKLALRIAAGLADRLRGMNHVLFEQFRASARTM